MVTSTVFGFKGLPHISDKYQGDKYLASRHKIKKIFEKVGNVKSLYVDMNTGGGRVTIEASGNDIKIIEAICNSPMGMIKNS